MRSQIKLGRIFGIEIGLHYSWFIIALLIAFSLAQQFRHDNPAWTPLVVWSAALLTAILFFAGLLAHELSHSLVARSHKLPVNRITLFALGGVSVIEKEAPNAWTEFLVAIVGPVTSVVIGGALTIIALSMGGRLNQPPPSPGVAILLWLGIINIALGIFNMVPGYPLDGGRVLRSVIWGITHSMEKATFIAARIGQGIGVLFILWGIYRFFTGEGIPGLWISFIGWFLLQSAGANYMEVEMKQLLQGVRAGDLMTRDCAKVDGNLTVQQFVDEVLLRSGDRCFLVLEDDHMAGLVTPHEVRTLERERWPVTRVQQIMKPVGQVHAVLPDTPIMDVLEIMAKEDLNQVPVVRNQRLEGILTRTNILQLLKSRTELKTT